MWTGDVQNNYPTQWALNPSAYQNLPNEQVDWATLAQQWIKMKETFPVSQVPPAPPPPSIKADIEAGEAPMDMSKDEVTPTPSAGNSQDGSSWGSWNNWGQWGWGWGGGGSTGAVGSTVPPDKAVPYTFTPSATPIPFSTEAPTTTFDYNHGAPVASENFEQQGYWSEGPAPFVRNKPSQWRGEYRGSSNRKQSSSSSKVEEVEPDTTAIIDAAKRKQLPAWIREGLEKMEREKQKKIERERQFKERQEEILRRKQEEEEALAAGIPVKSKFETDSEESEKEAEEVPVKPRKSRFDNSTSSPVVPKPIITKSYSPPPPVKRKSREEIMQEVMQQVRYVLTDILMTVTNEEMQKIAEEVLADFRAKAPAAQLRNTPALTSLTGKLGLGIYDTDSEDSSDDSEDEKPTKRENGVDSDDELRERISRKKQEFARIERDIEHMVEQQEERERERERELAAQDVVDESNQDQGQVEPKLIHPGTRLEVQAEEPRHTNEVISPEQNHTQFFTPERLYKVEKESLASADPTEDSDSSKSESSSRSSSSSGYKKSKKSSKKKKDKKSSKRKHKRSLSRGSERKRSRRSERKSGHRYEERERRTRSRSRSRSRGYYEEHRHYRRHSNESSHKRRHHSYSHSPEHSRGKKSSHRSRD